jgi:hypothetical protein
MCARDALARRVDCKSKMSITRLFRQASLLPLLVLIGCSLRLAGNAGAAPPLPSGGLPPGAAEPAPALPVPAEPSASSCPAPGADCGSTPECGPMAHCFREQVLREPGGVRLRLDAQMWADGPLRAEHLFREPVRLGVWLDAGVRAVLALRGRDVHVTTTAAR